MLPGTLRTTYNKIFNNQTASISQFGIDAFFLVGFAETRYAKRFNRTPMMNAKKINPRIFPSDSDLEEIYTNKVRTIANSLNIIALPKFGHYTFDLSEDKHRFTFYKLDAFGNLKTDESLDENSYLVTRCWCNAEGDDIKVLSLMDIVSKQELSDFWYQVNQPDYYPSYDDFDCFETKTSLVVEIPPYEKH